MTKMLFLGLALLLLIPIFAFAQNGDSVKAPKIDAQNQQIRQGTLSEQTARGEIPFSFADERLRLNVKKIRRLSPISLPPQSDEMGKPLQIGVLRDLDPPLRLSDDSASFGVDGGRIYLLAMISQDAKSIRVRFSQTKLSEGVRIFVFSQGSKNEFYGPFGKGAALSDGTFWSPPLNGESVVIEAFIPIGNKMTLNDFFVVDKISHNFVGNGECLLSTPGNCHNEVGSGYANMAAAVGYLEFTTQQGSFLCSGTLLTAASGTSSPFLLTANHCFSSESSAQSLRVYWLYSSGDSPPGGTPFTDGATLLSSTTQSDFTFVRLTGTIPGGVLYSGWDAVDPSPNSLIAGIHHPSGSHRRISFGFTNVIGSLCASLPSACGNFIPVTWSSGVTEPGSSGSGLFYTASTGGRLIGTLTGGGSSCNSPNEPDWYGRFRLTYHKIASYIADSPCSYNISPGSNNFTSAGGSGSFGVATGGACYQSPVVTQPNTVQAFTNSTPITIADRVTNSSPPGMANLYPSTINISGFNATVARVRVRLINLTHTYPDDLDFLLVGPTGQQALLMSDSGGSVSINNTTLMIDQSGNTLLPDSNGIVNGTFRPSNYTGATSIDVGGTDNFPSPASGQGTYDNSLEFFNGTNPNGIWKLYVVDDETGDVGAINGGWSLELATTGSSWLTVTSGSGYGDKTVNYSVGPNPVGQPARTGVIDIGGQTHTVFQNAGPTPTPTPTPTPIPTPTPQRRAPFDYDGDGKTDVSVFRPSNSVWYIRPSSGGFAALQWGSSISGDKLVPADYDGDGKTDIAVYRPSTGVWYIVNSSNGTFTVTGFGLATDIPAPGDFDGDGKADIAIFRPSDGRWWINRSSAGLAVIPWGINGDVPVTGDYDGDGKADTAIFRPSTGVWYIQRSTLGFAAVAWGISTDKVVPADYDGDGKTDIAVFRPSTGVWYIFNSSNGSFTIVGFGLPTDLASPGDYDGDGKVDIAIFRPSDGNWWISGSTAGLMIVNWGLNGDKPTPNAFVY